MRGTNDIPQMNEAQFNHFDVAFAVSKALEGQSLAKHGSRAPIITPRVSDNFAAQAAHQNQVEHHNPFVKHESPGSWCPNDQAPTRRMPPAAAFPPKNQWHMKCISCSYKVEIHFSHDVSITDILPKNLFGKKKPQYPNGTSTTTCPPCLSRLARDANALGWVTNVTNDFFLHDSCLDLSKFVTSYGEELPLIENNSKVLHYDSNDAMDLVKSRDPHMSVSILPPSNTSD